MITKDSSALCNKKIKQKKINSISVSQNLPNISTKFRDTDEYELLLDILFYQIIDKEIFKMSMGVVMPMQNVDGCSKGEMTNRKTKAAKKTQKDLFRSKIF